MESEPEIVKFSDHFYNIVTPISMTIIGMKLGTVKLSSLFKSGRLYYVSLLKLVVFPVAITALLIALRSVPLNIDMFVAFSMPTAGLAATFADEFGGDGDNAVIFTLGTTILSVLTIPTIYWLINVLIK